MGRGYGGVDMGRGIWGRGMGGGRFGRALLSNAYQNCIVSHNIVCGSLFNTMQERKVRCNTVSYNGAINACEKGEKLQFALCLLGTMAHAKLEHKPSALLHADAYSYFALQMMFTKLPYPTSPPPLVKGEARHIGPGQSL